MIVSEARILANRQNSLKSTGPKTLAGKENSRANALKHGLCSSVVVLEDLKLVQQRSTEFFETMKPQNEVHVWMVEQAALMSIRIDRCQRIERRIRDKVALRAELTWDNDRRFEVEVLARSLSKDPAATVEALRRTSHGCEWMMTRWALLAYAADVHSTWTEEQSRLAFDLLATPPAFRTAQKPGVLIDLEGRVIDSGGDPASVARREIALLKERREVVGELDEVDQALASSDLINEGDPELRRLRRYESILHSRLRWSLAQINIQSPYRCPDPSLRPHWEIDHEAVPAPAPTPTPEPVPVAEIAAPAVIPPVDDLEPVEPDPVAKETILLPPRPEKALRKNLAQARRETRRLKGDKLRA